MKLFGMKINRKRKERIMESAIGSAIGTGAVITAVGVGYGLYKGGSVAIGATKDKITEIRLNVISKMTEEMEEVQEAVEEAAEEKVVEETTEGNTIMQEAFNKAKAAKANK